MASLVGHLEVPLQVRSGDPDLDLVTRSGVPGQRGAMRDSSFPCSLLSFTPAGHWVSPPPLPSSVEVRNSPLHPLPLQQGNIKVLNIMEGLLEVNGWGGGRGGDRDKGRAWGWTGRGLLPPPVRPCPPAPFPHNTHICSYNDAPAPSPRSSAACCS